jgi:tRNA G18 (ribose-2'-O)-methylase SpoU
MERVFFQLKNIYESGAFMETKLDVRSYDSTLSPEEFEMIPRFPVTVVLDNLRSAFNVGSIIRTADCTLVERIYCCGITAHPPHRKLDKTSLGALPYISVTHESNTLKLVKELKRKGNPIIALELTNRSRLIWETQFPLPLTLILGNEALGISKDILFHADEIVEIPMMGFKNSINVSVAFGIVIYEIQRQHWQNVKEQSRLRSGLIEIPE